MPTWTLSWRRGPLTIELPDDGSIQPIERPEPAPRGTAVEQVREVLEHPIGCPPLREQVKPGDRVAFLVTDMQDRIVGQDGVGDVVLAELDRAGVRAQDVTLVHAAGMHGHPGGRSRLGEAFIARVGRYVEHDPYDECNTYLGVTRAGTPVWVNRWVAEADFVMGVGQCSPSLYGFQGGAGIILPGVSSCETIRYNHNRILTDRVSSAWGPGNPMRQDVMDVGDLARLRFKIDFTGNRREVAAIAAGGAQVGAVFGGYFREEWPVAVDYVERNLMVPVEPAELYVFAPGGDAPLVNSIYMQIETAERVTVPDGVVIAVVSAHKHTPFPPRPLEETLQEFLYVTRQWCAETGDGNPMHAFWHFRDGVCKEELLARPLSDISRIIARMQGEPRSTTHVWSHRRSIEARRTILVSEGVSPEDGAAMGFIATYPDFPAAYDHALSLTGPRPRTIANLPPNQAMLSVLERR